MLQQRFVIHCDRTEEWHILLIVTVKSVKRFFSNAPQCIEFYKIDLSHWIFSLLILCRNTSTPLTVGLGGGSLLYSTQCVNFHLTHPFTFLFRCWKHRLYGWYFLSTALYFCHKIQGYSLIGGTLRVESRQTWIEFRRGRSMKWEKENIVIAGAAAAAAAVGSDGVRQCKRVTRFMVAWPIFGWDMALAGRYTLH